MKPIQLATFGRLCNVNSHDYSKKIMISEIPDALSLLDLAAPVNGIHARSTVVRVERKVGVHLAERVCQISVANLWSDDTLYAAAWMVVRDRVLGQSDVRLHEYDEKSHGPARVVTSVHQLLPEISSRVWITQFEKDRHLAERCEDKALVVDIDHVWLRRDVTDPSNQFSAALTLGVRGGGAAALIATFSEAIFDRPMIESLLDSALQVVTSFVKSLESPLGSIDILGTQQ